MRLIFILWSAIFLSACSIEGMVEKAVPENVRADHTSHIDDLLVKDTARIIDIFGLDMTDETVQKSLEDMLGQVPEGQEIRRDYVGMNSSSSLSTGEGKSRNIELVTEVQTQAGFMTVTSQYTLNDAGQCCALKNMVVKKYDQSPMRKTWETAAKIGKVFGILLLISLALILFFVIRASRKRARKKDSA